MSTHRLEISYDGRPFSGWAAQAGLRTLQAEIERAFEQILGEPVALTVAGRTDAGVHAWAQVASFDHGPPLPEGLLRGVNALTPPEIAINAVITAPDGFDARRDARSRTYCYRVSPRQVEDPLERGRALHWPYPLDRVSLDACAASVLGRHDFTAFTPSQTAHVFFNREVMRCEWVEATGLGGNDVLELWVEADAFLRSMVRVLAGTMLEVGTSRRGQDNFEGLLRGAPRKAAGETAPAHALYLASVRYD